MQNTDKKKTKETFPGLDRELMPWELPPDKILFCCPFCRFNTENKGDIHYHIVGYHRVLQEFFNDY